MWKKIKTKFDIPVTILLMVMVFLMVVLSACFYAIVHGASNTSDFFSLNFTNTAFATQLGVASICFSWSSSLETRERKHDAKQVAHAAEFAICSAVLFMVSSLINYCLDTQSQQIAKVHLYGLLHNTFAVFLAIAIITGLYVLGFIILMISGTLLTAENTD